MNQPLEVNFMESGSSTVCEVRHAHDDSLLIVVPIVLREGRLACVTDYVLMLSVLNNEQKYFC